MKRWKCHSSCSKACHNSNHIRSRKFGSDYTYSSLPNFFIFDSTFSCIHLSAVWCD